MDGVAVRAADPLIDGHGLDRTALARGLLAVLLRQIMVTGVFHADPHPGNVLVRSDGTLALLDFGSVGRLDSLQRSGMLRAFLALSQRDPGSCAMRCWTSRRRAARRTRICWRRRSGSSWSPGSPREGAPILSCSPVCCA